MTIFIALIRIRLCDAEAMVRRCRGHWQSDLFFASASGKFKQQRVHSVAFAFAVAVFVFALVRTAMLPR